MVIQKNLYMRLTWANDQTGTALIVSLIFLLIMTLIGITAVRTTTLEEKMAGNMRDRNLAFQAAEAALRDAESALSPDNLTIRPFTCRTPPCQIWEKNYLNIDFSKPIQDTPSPPNGWDWDNDRLADQYDYDLLDSSIDLQQVNKYPRYIIEELDFVADELGIGYGVVPGRLYYRIVARGTGGSDTAQVVTESIYTRRF